MNIPLIKLENQGLIFDIRKYPQFAGYEFAQSPQLLDMGEFFRVFFSTRLKARTIIDDTVSEIHFVDFNQNFSEVIGFSTSPVINLGEKGGYDEHGIFPFHVRRFQNRLYGFISGWSRRVSVDVDTSIGISESTNQGVTFERIGPGPIISSNFFDPFLVGDPWIMEQNKEYKMYYISGTKWERFEVDGDSPQRTYKIRLATSTNLLDWYPQKGEIIESILGPNESQALPTVFEFKGLSIMAFCFRQSSDFRTNPKRSYKLGFAYSLDSIKWTRNDDLLEISSHSSQWDQAMSCYPNINLVDGKVILLYNGNAFGKHGFGLAVSQALS